MLVLDDLHEADEATLRLTHYLARCATAERIALLIGYRPTPVTDAFEQFRASLTTRAGAFAHELGPLAAPDAEQLARRHQPERRRRHGGPHRGSWRPDRHSRSSSWPVGPGPPRSWERSADSVALAALSPKTRDILQRVAVLGTTFDTDEFVSLADLPDDEAFVHLDAALDAGVIAHTGTHYQFRHSLVRDALTADVAPHRRRRIHRDAAARLEALGASPARIGHHLVEAGDPAAAGPHLVRAAEREAAIGAYRDAFELVERVQAHVEGPLRARALALRADLLFALGDPSALVAYRHAIELADGDGGRLLRARLARAAMFAGDMDTAAAALENVEPNGGPADGDILLARSQVAYFIGDIGRRVGAGRGRPPPGPRRRQELAGARPRRPPGPARPRPGRVVRPHARRAAAHLPEPRAGPGHLRRLPLPGRVPALRADPLRRGHRAGPRPA